MELIETSLCTGQVHAAFSGEECRALQLCRLLQPGVASECSKNAPNRYQPG